jgi:hypothetical protein
MDENFFFFRKNGQHYNIESKTSLFTASKRTHYSYIQSTDNSCVGLGKENTSYYTKKISSAT